LEVVFEIPAEVFLVLGGEIEFEVDGGRLFGGLVGDFEAKSDVGVAGVFGGLSDAKRTHGRPLGWRSQVILET